MRRSSILFVLVLLLAVCSPAAAQDSTLREAAAKRKILIGSAMAGSPERLTSDPEYLRVLAREFSMITAENAMKPGPLRPTRETFAFEQADAMIAFAGQNGMKVRGHTLVWHQQLPGWLTSGTWTNEQAHALLDEHIRKIAGHFRGKVYGWDVVNEAIDDQAHLRKSFWSDHLGRSYIEQAFRIAHEADPDAVLFYNDYSIESKNAKSDSVYALLKDLKARGVPVHGIGFQSHFELDSAPSRQAMVENFSRFAALGLKVHITELDVRVKLPASPDDLEKQARVYHDVVSACLAVSGCEAVVLWGFTDKRSWIPRTFQGYGDALIFDASYRPKPAYQAIRQALAGGI